jgi:hypothetical protein
MKYRRNQQEIISCENSFYFQRRNDERGWRKGKNLGGYSDKECRVDNGSPCMHLQLRFQGTEATERFGICEPIDLNNEEMAKRYWLENVKLLFLDHARYGLAISNMETGRKRREASERDRKRGMKIFKSFATGNDGRVTMQKFISQCGRWNKLVKPAITERLIPLRF